MRTTNADVAQNVRQTTVPRKVTRAAARTALKGVTASKVRASLSPQQARVFTNFTNYNYACRKASLTLTSLIKLLYISSI